MSELPDLPEPDLTSYQTEAVMRRTELRSYSESQMYAYGQECARMAREEAAEIAERRAQWEPCDCGCPNGTAPRSAADVALIRVAAVIRAIDAAMATSTPARSAQES